MRGLLAAAIPPANTPTTLYTIPEGLLQSFTVCAANLFDGPNNITIQLCNESAGPENTIEPGSELAKAGVCERSGIILNEGQYIRVSSTNGDVAFTAWGIDETI